MQPQGTVASLPVERTTVTKIANTSSPSYTEDAGSRVRHAGIMAFAANDRTPRGRHGKPEAQHKLRNALRPWTRLS